MSAWHGNSSDESCASELREPSVDAWQLLSSEGDCASLDEQEAAAAWHGLSSDESYASEASNETGMVDDVVETRRLQRQLPRQTSTALTLVLPHHSSQTLVIVRSWHG